MLKGLMDGVPNVDDFGMSLCMQRLGTPNEAAKLIAFLLSDESSYVTGACYEIDAGLTT